jgi:hypothetical protein
VPIFARLPLPVKRVFPALLTFLTLLSFYFYQPDLKWMVFRLESFFFPACARK